MIVVSNTSPIVNLAAVDQLHLLKQIYGRLLIPRAVYREIAVVGSGLPGAAEGESEEWIETRAVKDNSLVVALSAELDAGEAEAIALAVQGNADLLLLDERGGRRVARRLGLHYLGILGVLIEAKDQGLIVAVKPIVDDLIAKAGFWISRDLYGQIIQAAKE